MADNWTLTIDTGGGQVSTDYATWAALDTALSAYRTGKGSTLLHAKIKQNGSPTLPTSFFMLFFDCRNLQTVLFDGVDTSSVENMSSTFNACPSLLSLDLSSFNTSALKDASRMFRGSKLKVLDLSSFDTANVLRTDQMFYLCNELVTIYAGDEWSVANVTISADMFNGCTKLVGAISYDPSKIDHNYANWTTGYLTYKAPPAPEPTIRPTSRIYRMNSPHQVRRIN